MKPWRWGIQERNVVIFVLVRGLSLAVPLLTLPVLSRAINPRGFGMLAFAQSIALYFSSVVDFGFNLTAISTVAELRDRPQALRTLFWSVTGFRALLLLGCLMVLAPLSVLVGRSTDEQDILALSCLLVIGGTITPSWLYQGLERGSSFAMLSLAPRLAIFPLILLYVRQATDAPRAAAIAFGAEFLAGLLLFSYAWIRLVPGRPNMKWPIARAEAARAFDAWLGTVLSTLTTNLNPLVLRHVAGLHAVGVFSAADRLVRVIFSFYYPVVHAYQASVTRNWTEGNNAANRLVIGKVLILFTTMSMLVVIGAQIFGSRIILLVFGASFAASAVVFRIESLWLLFSGFSTVAIYFLYIAPRHGRALRAKYVLAALLHCVCLVLLAHYFAEAGAAAAAVLVQAVFAAALWAGARKLTSSQPVIRAVTSSP